MTKEELIKEAWGGVFNPHICENGWFNMWYLQHVPNMEKFLDKTEYDIINKCVRPKSLRGIEHNNGWIKIVSEKDLPKTEMQDCFIMDKKLGVIVGRFTLSEKNIWLENATHYQPIEKPKPPVH